MNIIFVCTGNTCRSPMAEYYLKSKNLDGVNVISRGFSGGEGANPKSVAVMGEVGIDISAHISRCITAEEIKNADAVICMTESHKAMLMAFASEQKQIFVLGGGIPDPFGCDIEKQSFSTPWSENAIRESMTSSTVFYTAKSAEKVVGYIGVSKIAGEGYVTNIAVLPEYRRKGVGKRLLEYVINDCKNQLEFISLEVRVSNDAAISLYKKFGFKPVGLRKRFYTNPTEDAVIMTKNFI